MEPTFHSSTIIKDIVTRMPKASGILRNYKIDFCCGGNRPIREAIIENKLEENEVLTRLNETYLQQQTEPTQEFSAGQASNRELIEYIVQTHHTYLNNVLPELSQYVTKILRVHGSSHPELNDVYQLFHEMKMELDQHMIQEEEGVFPLILRYELPAINHTIETLIDDHQAVGNLLKQLRKVTLDYRLPEGACTTYTVTYRKLEELEADLFQHIHLENNVLFPRVNNQSFY
jgi:regulator of cell morphogenesis and NO signaling